MNNSASIVIIDKEDNSRNIIKNYVRNIPETYIDRDFEDSFEAYTHVVEHRTNIIIVDISEDPDVTFELINKITSINKQAKIIVTSYNSDADLVIKAMRIGAREFLTKPIKEEEIQEAVIKMRDLSLGNLSDSNHCKIISTFSNKGGIGKTATAVNLALELANITKEKVALIDLNLQLGDVTTFLDLTPSFDISYVVNNIHRVDETFLLSTLEQYKDTSLYVLADPPFLEQAEDITSDQISKLFDALKKTFSYIVVDTGSNFDGKTITVLDNSDLILLVTIVNLPAIRNCQRCLELFERLGYTKDKVKIVLNRYMENEEIKTEDVEDVLDRKIYWKIPNNYFTIMSAINKGIPVGLVNPDSNISRNYRDLAAMLSDSIVSTKPTRKQQRTNNFNILGIFKK
ncbi:response regulator [bacterium]|nr:response regulator [bacterium]